MSKGRDNRVHKETKENRENSEAAQRERYYATIHKVAHQASEKIPETSEDISPYATFQVNFTIKQTSNFIFIKHILFSSYLRLVHWPSRIQAQQTHYFIHLCTMNGHYKKVAPHHHLRY